MKRILESHISYYASLIILLALCCALILRTAKQPGFQLIVIILTAFLYIIWGIAHHKSYHYISLKIVLEYVLIGLIGMGLMLLLVT
jgi:hypothetical protein